MPRLFIAIHNVQLPEASEGGWYHLIPAGTFMGRDGRGPYHLDSGDQVIAAFRDNGADLCVDYNHQSLTADEHSGPVPASGWIKELEFRDTGLWGRIEWTETAQKLLDAKEYRYLSPVLLCHKKTGEVVRLQGAALTNDPNLHLQAAASRQGDSMDELLERLRWLLNLPITATAEEIVAELDKLKEQVKAGTDAGEAMCKTLGLTAGTTLAEIATAVHSRINQTPDPAQWVPKTEYDRVAHALAQTKTDQKTAKVDAAVREAMAQGKLPPGLESWAREYATRDLAGFQAYVAGAPAIAGESHARIPRPEGADTQPTLTPEQEAVAHTCGLSKEAFAATLADKE